MEKNVSQTGRKHCGKKEKLLAKEILPFPTLFSRNLYSAADTYKPGLIWERVKGHRLKRSVKAGRVKFVKNLGKLKKTNFYCFKTI